LIFDFLLLLGKKYVSKLQSYMMWSQFFRHSVCQFCFITNLFQSGNFFHCVHVYTVYIAAFYNQS